MTAASRIEAWELLVRYHRQATAAMDDSLRVHFDHSLDDYDVLHQLKTSGRPIRMTDLGRRLLIANSSCNRIVGRLVDQGLVRRSAGESDRREVLVELTAEGRRLHRRMAARHTRDIQHHFANKLSTDDHRRLREVFEKLLASDPGN